ncbi:hypothetical protein ACJX0J_009403, partial [Zea mays]
MYGEKHLEMAVISGYLMNIGIIKVCLLTDVCKHGLPLSIITKLFSIINIFLNLPKTKGSMFMRFSQLVLEEQIASTIGSFFLDDIKPKENKGKSGATCVLYQNTKRACVWSRA